MNSSAESVHVGEGFRAAERLTVLPHELAFLLEEPRSTIVDLLASGGLRDASRDRWRRIAVEDARALINRRIVEGRTSPLAALLLEEMASGRLLIARGEELWLTLPAALGRLGAGEASSDV